MPETETSQDQADLSQVQEIAGVHRSQFLEWRHNPVTKLFFAYHAAKRDFMKIKIMEMWMSGSAELSKAEVPRGQIIEIEEMMNLPFEAFVAMFGEKQEEESAENAAEVN